MTYALGTDPDAKGAISLVGDEGLVAVWPLPPSFADTCTILRLCRPLTSLFILEQQHTRPSDGRVGAFTLGTRYGYFIGAALALGYTVVIVSPQRWKSFFKLTGKGKEGACDLASQLFGRQFSPRRSGEAEAALLALWGLQQAESDVAVFPP
jgi:hypothetical protein